MRGSFALTDCDQALALSPEFAGFIDTAAVMATLDLVIIPTRRWRTWLARWGILSGSRAAPRGSGAGDRHGTQGLRAGSLRYWRSP